MIYYSNKCAVLTSMKNYDEAHKCLETAFEVPGSNSDFAKLAKLYHRKARLY